MVTLLWHIVLGLPFAFLGGMVAEHFKRRYRWGFVCGFLFPPLGLLVYAFVQVALDMKAKAKP